jgi:predicted transcriptional regulator
VLDRPVRRERADEIEELAARGFRNDEIAEKLALARSTVNKYRRDPDGDRERARRERYCPLGQLAGRKEMIRP